MDKAIEDFLASRNILATNIRLFHEGHRDLYRVISVELRKLLCDGRNSLVPRLFPNARLHPLRGRLPDYLKEGLVLHIPTMINFDGKGGARITQLFDKTAQPIPVEEWLTQDLFNRDITINELIRSVADKESAHSDRKYNETIAFIRSVKLLDEDIHRQHIVAIGEYILELLDLAIEISSLRVLEGYLPPRALGLVMEWASQHQEELVEDWNLASKSQPPKKIAPLV